MPFTYTQGIPNPPSAPSANVADMQTNTNSIYSIINVEHMPFQDANAGIHRQVTMLPESAPSIPLTGGSIYTSTINGNAWPVWINALGSTAILSSISSPVVNGYASLPGIDGSGKGIIIQWGQASPVGSSLSVNFNTPFTTLFSVVVTGTSVNKGVGVTAASATGFTVQPITGGSSGGSIFWMAIGVK